MVPICIASNSGFAGKTFLALGLALKLADRGYKVGYVKPVGKTPVKQGSGVFDADAVFIREALSLSDPLDVVSPFVYSFENQARILDGSLHDAQARVKAALEAQRDKDFVVVGGAGDIFEGATLGLDLLSIAPEIGASVLMIDAWKGDVSMDAFIGARRLLGKNFAGGVLNKVPGSAMPHVRDDVKPFLEKSGVAVIGIFKKDALLESIQVSQLVAVLNGKVLCCDDRLDEFVEHFSIGAMDVDSALTHFRRMPNKAVITGAHRSDIQLAAIETSTKCIILTGGLHTNDVVLSKAQAKGVPIISVSEDTFTTVDRIEGIMGKSRIREKGKLARAKELMEAGFDLDRFLAALKQR